jgi:hypothetical protein
MIQALHKILSIQIAVFVFLKHHFKGERILQDEQEQGNEKDEKGEEKDETGREI